jgi:hypothetical protein
MSVHDRNLESALGELAACAHPIDQQQKLVIVGRELKPILWRCSDCGAVRYEGGRSWTRPMLVAHVIGATRHP